MYIPESVSTLEIVQQETGRVPKKQGHIWRTFCPFHNDKEHPNLAIYEDGHWFCYNCHAKGSNAVAFYAKYRQITYQEAQKALYVEPTGSPRKRISGLRVSEHGYDAQNAPQTVLLNREGNRTPVPMELVEQWHYALCAKPELRQYLYGRLFTDETIDREMWGWSDRSYSIPVWEGEPQKSPVVAVRFRNANPDSSLRYWGLKGYAPRVLYNKHAILGKKTAWILGGEYDAALIYQDGLSACSPINGFGNFQKEWTPLFDSAERVWVVPDNTPPSEYETSIRISGLFGIRGRIYQWNPDWHFKDYTEARQAGITVKEFTQWHN